MILTTAQEDELREALREEVKSLALAAASWTFDGNTKTETYRRTLDMLEEGDPEIYDALPSVDWSGQWADGPDWDDMFAAAMPEGCDYETCKERGREDEYDALSDDLWLEIGCDYASDVIITEVERVCRYHLETEEDR